ncbi:carboxymuconolactone decarboxylase family protein [Rhodopirellula sp. JC740]|uniref:Carboxymuconolactone decarboxylase family protein n=1 Tax=Rhodopirellula halodulae TaxID=2894198 RepID=A0ABS8NFY1_9BACT|nr:carboxymuconolactone decarboxylase family protein [Rhodopirellula sp. JC740]MCC9642447.1 carboxymuconolactone decarboxylase family protein [Rhodopirellula sp. JC740]
MRANYFQLIPSEIRQLTSIESTMANYSIGTQLLELIKLRVSQINGCSFCVSLHTQQLRLMNETNERIDLVSVWQEAPCYTDRERTAFRWAESLTRLADECGIHAPLYTESVNEFGEEGLSQLSLAVAMINTWNRLAVPFQTDHQFIASLLQHPATTN